MLHLRPLGHLSTAKAYVYFVVSKKWGERRELNPRMMESQSIALPLGYARHLLPFSIDSLTKRILFD